MPKRLRRSRPAAPAGALVGLALIVSACGSGTAGDTATAAPAATEPTTNDSGGGTTAESASESASTDEPAAEPAPAPTENLFAPVDVVRVGDGATINLADELGGGDLPVLLWFWAPH